MEEACELDAPNVGGEEKRHGVVTNDTAAFLTMPRAIENDVVDSVIGGAAWA